MKVEQFYNKNQFHLWSTTKAVDYLQSYDSTVVKVEVKAKPNSNGLLKTASVYITLGRDWDYSTTTSKHVYLFLEEYGHINFDGITNKRLYVNKLIKDGVINYDANMR